MVKRLIDLRVKLLPSHIPSLIPTFSQPSQLRLTKMSDDAFNPYFHSAMDKLADDTPHYVELSSNSTTTAPISSQSTNSSYNPPVKGKDVPAPYYSSEEHVPLHSTNPYDALSAGPQPDNYHHNTNTGLVASVSNVVASMTGYAYQPQVDVSTAKTSLPFYLQGTEQIQLSTAQTARGDEFAAAEAYYHDENVNLLQGVGILEPTRDEFGTYFTASFAFLEIWAMSLAFWFLIGTAVYGYVQLYHHDKWTSLNAAMMLGSGFAFVLFVIILIPPCLFYSNCCNTIDLSRRTESERQLFFSCASMKTQHTVWRRRDHLERRLVAIRDALKPTLVITMTDIQSSKPLKSFYIPIDHYRSISPMPETVLKQVSRTGSIVLIRFNVEAVLPQEQRGALDYIKQKMVNSLGPDSMSNSYSFSHQLVFSHRKDDKPNSGKPYLEPIEINQLDHSSQWWKRLLCFNRVAATISILGCCYGPHYTMYHANTSSGYLHNVTFAIQLGDLKGIKVTNLYKYDSLNTDTANDDKPFLKDANGLPVLEVLYKNDKKGKKRNH